MSLRAFHIIFVIASVALCIFVAMWAFREYSATRSLAQLGMAVLFLVSAGLLVEYGRRVFRKLKDL